MMKMRKNNIFLRLATKREVEPYMDEILKCMIGDAELDKDDTIVVAYQVDDLSYHASDVAVFIYEELTEDVIDNVCIVNLSGDGTFTTACRKMFKFWREEYKVVRIPVEKSSHIVAWCDKLYERIEEDEDSIIFDGCKLKRRR